MSQPGNTDHANATGYLTHHEAVDVNRMTEIPMRSRDKQRWREPDTHFGSVDQGAVSIHEVYYDLRRLDWWDAIRIAFARIGGHYWQEERSMR